MEFYWKAITMIEAREQILSIQSNSYVWRKASDQKKAFKRLHELAYPRNFQEPIKTDMEGLAKILSR